MFQKCAAGDTIIREGDDDRAHFKFYIVEEGEARAYVSQEGEDVLMSHIGPGNTGRTLAFDWPPGVKL